MKVLIVTPCGLPVPAVKGGAVLTLVDNLINQNELKKECDFVVVSSYDKEAFCKASKFKKSKFIFLNRKKVLNFLDNLYESVYKLITKKQHRTKKEYLWKMYLIWKIKRVLLTEHFDKIIFENSGFLIKTLKDKRIINKYKNKIYFHIHNDIPDNIDISCLKECNILSISNYLKIKFDKIMGNNYRKKFYILKNGFNINLFEQGLDIDEKQQLLNKVGFSLNDKIIIFTGRITPEKGILELTEAFSKIEDKNVKLLVVGSHRFGDNQKSEFLDKMKEVFDSLGNRVAFTGYVNYNEIWKYYNIATMSVLPSTWQEPAGLTMLEASVCKVPVITTLSGGIPEYLPKELVTYLPLDDNLTDNIYKSINNVLNNLDEINIKANDACKYVKNNYSEEIFYNNFVNILKEKEDEK